MPGNIRMGSNGIIRACSGIRSHFRDWNPETTKLEISVMQMISTHLINSQIEVGFLKFQVFIKFLFLLRCIFLLFWAVSGIFDSIEIRVDFLHFSRARMRFGHGSSSWDGHRTENLA